MRSRGSAFLALRQPAKPSPAKPSSIIAQVDGSGPWCRSSENAALKVGAGVRRRCPCRRAASREIESFVAGPSLQVGNEMACRAATIGFGAESQRKSPSSSWTWGTKK